MRKVTLKETVVNGLWFAIAFMIAFWIYSKNWVDALAIGIFSGILFTVLLTFIFNSVYKYKNRKPLKQNK